jgi:hypothetical protein
VESKATADERRRKGRDDRVGLGLGYPQVRYLGIIRVGAQVQWGVVWASFKWTKWSPFARSFWPHFACSFPKDPGD